MTPTHAAQHVPIMACCEMPMIGLTTVPCEKIVDNIILITLWLSCM